MLFVEVAGTRLFYCERLSAKVRPEVCIARQKVANSKVSGKGLAVPQCRKDTMTHNAQANAYWMCRDCARGRELAEEMERLVAGLIASWQDV